jgi:hypothetical protein
MTMQRRKKRKRKHALLPHILRTLKKKPTMNKLGY